MHGASQGANIIKIQTSGKGGVEESGRCRGGRFGLRRGGSRVRSSLHLSPLSPIRCESRKEETEGRQEFGTEKRRFSPLGAARIRQRESGGGLYPGRVTRVGVVSTFSLGFCGCARDEHHWFAVVRRSPSRLPTHFMAEWQSRFDGSWLRRPATQTDLAVVITDAKTYTHSAFNIAAPSIYYALSPQIKDMGEEGKDTRRGEVWRRRVTALSFGNLLFRELQIMVIRNYV